VPDWELTFWTFASFYFWVWLSVGGFSILIGIIFYELKSRVFFTNSDTSDRLQPIVRKMIPLPMVIVFCWTIPTCYRIYFYIANENIYTLQLLSALSAASKGFFTSALLLGTNTVQMKLYVVKQEFLLSSQQINGDTGSTNPSTVDPGMCRLSSASTSTAQLQKQDHHHPSGDDDDEAEDHNRYLFRVAHDHERMSRVSSDSAVCGLAL
jgi:hypothetical protein